MLGKASEIKTCVIEDMYAVREWNLFQESHPEAIVIDIKYAPAVVEDRAWYTALIIYKEPTT